MNVRDTNCSSRFHGALKPITLEDFGFNSCRLIHGIRRVPVRPKE